MAKTDDCKHNKAVECKNHSSCAQCGWNPAEENRRKKYRRKHNLACIVLSKMRSHGKT